MFQDSLWLNLVKGSQSFQRYCFRWIVADREEGKTTPLCVPPVASRHVEEDETSRSSRRKGNPVPEIANVLCVVSEHRFCRLSIDRLCSMKFLLIFIVVAGRSSFRSSNRRSHISIFGGSLSKIRSTVGTCFYASMEFFATRC
ncbi:hypothetical protein KSP39_PZI021002 [Platanthera zijinensis]|uniref:Uncharacterized protein n=1 Tax=Platanthera zijinensis TaxID=2320716 RepID=A0AAP0FWJ4_9ASPA